MDILQRLKAIYSAIDESYAETQRHYNFSCKGCAEICCATKFHHYTIIEELYLTEGLKKLSQNKIKEIISRSEKVIEIRKSSPDDIRVMCPLNESGLCVLYEHRPMICRVHGVPYELRRMDMRFEHGDGCYRFIEEKFGDDKSFKLNRTGFYFEIAMLEKETREKLKFTGKYKKTIPEMALSIFYGKDFKED